MEPPEELERLGYRARERSQPGLVDSPNRARGTEGVAIGEQRVVAEREERAVQGREDAELVVRPLDGGQRVAQRDDLFALVIRAPAYEDVGNMARLERPHVFTGDVVPSVHEATREETDVTRDDGDGLVRTLAFRDRPATLMKKPVDEGSDGIGKRRVDSVAGDLSVIRVRTRDR